MAAEEILRPDHPKLGVRCLLSTKATFRSETGPWRTSAPRAAILRACELASAACAQTTSDILPPARLRALTPVEGPLRTLERSRARRQVRYIACSIFPAGI